MPTHASDYVRVRNAAGTLQTNAPEVEAALRRREEDGFTLVSSVPDTHNGDLVGILLLFVKTA